MGRLAGKNFLITGGNSGIGLAAAQEFDREGARVAICGLNERTLQAANFTVRLLIPAGVVLASFPALVCEAGTPLWLHASDRCVLPRCAAAWR